MKKNPYTGKIVEYHILQSFPVTCLNRDDVGSPKTALIGGVPRSRVSSQCWKRRVRMDLHSLLDNDSNDAEPQFQLGIRTKHISDLVSEACKKLGATDEQAAICGETISQALAKDTLVFISPAECNSFAEYAKEKGFDLQVPAGKEGAKKLKTITQELVKLSKKILDKNFNVLDIALFGRMVAQAPEMEVEAAASFSHAISTHKSVPEIDYFTALDDMRKPEEQGSAHLGPIEYNSATYYRYISLDLGQLADTFGIEEESDEEIKKAVEIVTKALFVAVPTARQHSCSGASPWDYARVYVRKGQRLQVPFETPVRCDNGYLNPSIKALDSYLDKKEKMCGSLFGKIAGFEWGKNEDYSIDDLIHGIQASI